MTVPAIAVANSSDILNNSKQFVAPPPPFDVAVLADDDSAEELSEESLPFDEEPPQAVPSTMNTANRRAASDADFLFADMTMPPRGFDFSEAYEINRLKVRHQRY
jgi:hypothetical protein